MSNPITHEVFKEELQKGLTGLGESLRETIKENNRDLVKHFTTALVDFKTATNDRFEQMDERFNQIDAKLEAIMEMLAMRKEMHNLVRELRLQGMTLDETKIFIS